MKMVVIVGALKKNIFKQRLEKDKEVSRGMCGGRKRKFKELEQPVKRP